MEIAKKNPRSRNRATRGDDSWWQAGKGGAGHVERWAAIAAMASSDQRVVMLHFEQTRMEVVEGCSNEAGGGDLQIEGESKRQKEK
jgi:hypothetical protein